MSRAVFLDRDGVIIREVNYLRRLEQIKVLRGSPEAIRRLREAGYKIIVVTNQSGVARGYLTRSALSAIHRELKRRLGLSGARLDALYFCPHHPQAGARKLCSCRKPGIGMLKAARSRFGIDMKKSYLVGDSLRDVQTARNAGCRAVLVRTGHGGRDGGFKVRPDRVCRNLAKAADWILKEGS